MKFQRGMVTERAGRKPDLRGHKNIMILGVKREINRERSVMNTPDHRLWGWREWVLLSKRTGVQFPVLTSHDSQLSVNPALFWSPWYPH